MKYLTVVSVALVVFLLTSAAIHSWLTLVIGVAPSGHEQFGSCLAAVFLMWIAAIAADKS